MTARIDDRQFQGTRRSEWLEIAPRRCERLVFDLDAAHQPTRIARIANVDSLAVRPEGSKIATGIDHSARDAKVSQDLDRAIDRETLGDASQVDPNAGTMKANTVVRHQLDRCTRCHVPRICRPMGQRRGSKPMFCKIGAMAMSNRPAERQCRSTAASRTLKVQRCTPRGRANASLLSRPTSLLASWKLMSACTLATASKAASIAARMSDGAASATAISTNVPRSGRARRALFEAGDNCHDPLYAFGHVMRRQGGAGNIANVAAHLQRTGAGLADKLR